MYLGFVHPGRDRGKVAPVTHEGYELCGGSVGISGSSSSSSSGSNGSSNHANSSNNASSSNSIGRTSFSTISVSWPVCAFMACTAIGYEDQQQGLLKEMSEPQGSLSSPSLPAQPLAIRLNSRDYLRNPHTRGWGGVVVLSILACTAIGELEGDVTVLSQEERNFSPPAPRPVLASELAEEPQW